MAETSYRQSDWAILDDLRDTLAAATVDGAPLLASVELAADAEREVLARPTGRGPLAALHYLGDSERETLEGLRLRLIEVRLHLACRCAPAASAARRLQEALALLGRVKNAVEAHPPDGICAWGDRHGWRDRLAWSDTQIRDRGDGPWLRASTVLTLASTLDDGVSR